MTLPLPLLHNGDSYLIDVVGVSPRSVRCNGAEQYLNNQNVVGHYVRFRDMDPDLKRAVIRQINTRYKGMTVLT
jgi:hypothetical protein